MMSRAAINGQREPVVSEMKLTTQNRQRVSWLGLACQSLKDETYVVAAFAAGVNFFFSYSPPEPLFLNELKSLITTNREALLIVCISMGEPDGGAIAGSGCC